MPGESGASGESDDIGRQVAGSGSRLRIAWTAFSLVISVLFSLPLLAMLFYRGDFVVIANESVAYRFFACERIQRGESASTVWMPQGYVTSAIQELVVAAIDGAGGDRRPLRDRLRWFSVASLAGNVLALALLMVWVGRSDALLWADKLLIGLVALAPIYGTGTAGFYYSSLPDYLHLDVVLVTAGVSLFLVQWRGGLGGNEWTRVCILGAFGGLLVANKVTLATLAVMVALPAFLSGPRLLRTATAKLVLWLSCAALTIFVAILAFYCFRVSAVREMLPKYLHFMAAAGRESNFWAQTRTYLVTFGYGYFLAFWAAACAFAGASTWAARKSPAATKIVVLASTCCGLAQLYSVYRRSAGTTAFEASALLLAFGVIALAVTLPGTRVRMEAVVGTIGVLAALGFSTFPLAQNLQILRGSGARGQHLWDIHSEVLRIAAGRPIVVFYPDNTFHNEGVQELLLKGAADMFTWRISQAGQWIIDRHAPGMTFRSEGRPFTALAAPIPADAAVLWFDKPDEPPLTERYANLAGTFRRPGNSTRSWEIRQSDGAIQVVAMLSFVP